MSANIDPREFRNALGQFATGVTVITTKDAEGRPVGVTASSFNSVSLSPPLVLWSLDKSSGSLEAFTGNGHFAVHVLAAGQEDVSNNFARRGEDKFSAIECGTGEGGSPLLPECAARFQCQLAYQYDGGDHIILVGEVRKFESFDRPPLIFHGGRYANARQPPESVIDRASILDTSNGSFSSDFIGYLVSRAHYQLHIPILEHLASLGLREIHYFILSVVCIKEELPVSRICEFLSHTGQVPSAEDCDEMVNMGLLLAMDKPTHLYRVTADGKQMFVKLLASDMERQKKALDNFSSEELTDFIGYLRRLIDNTDPGVPDFWLLKSTQEQ